MYKIAKPLFLHCLTPLHAGTGSDLGYIDLPIQREKHTGFPKIEASSLKGAIREVFDRQIDKAAPSSNNSQEEKKNIWLAFGPDSSNASAHAGALGFTDARLLLFPVKSLKGVFAWITCPEVIQKFRRELEEICKVGQAISNATFELQDNQALIAGTELSIGNKIVLEEYAFDASNTAENEKATQLAKELAELLGISDLKGRLVVVHRNTFTDFVKLHTEVITRVRIGDSGTADGGGLFNEEFLPAESVLYTLVMASPIFKKKGEDKGIFEEENGQKEEEKVMAYFKQGLQDVFQLGGDATLGKGIVKAIKTKL
jgi:CRISPR-associated protein Cmr4